MHKIQVERTLQQGITKICMQERGGGEGGHVTEVRNNLQKERRARGQMDVRGMYKSGNEKPDFSTRLWYLERKIYPK